MKSGKSDEPSGGECRGVLFDGGCEADSRSAESTSAGAPTATTFRSKDPVSVARERPAAASVPSNASTQCPSCSDDDIGSVASWTNDGAMYG